MRTRDLLILGGSLCLLAGAGLVLLSQVSHAEELSPDVAASSADVEALTAIPAPSPSVVTADVERPQPAVAVDGGFRKSDRAETDTQGWTKGMVKGDIQLAVSVLDRLTTMTVVVEEARSAFSAEGFRHPHTFLVPIKLGAGTPTFEVRDIPFSEYPYVVSVHAPGLNGGRRTVTIDADHALVDDIVLAITPGSPFTVLVRDQDAVPFTGVDLRLLPVGDPGGRPRGQGITDNFGSVVFDNVLAGDYQILASLGGQSLTPTQTVTVQPGNFSFGMKVQGQGHVLNIPRGVPLQVQLRDGAGYGVPDAKVTATAADKVKLTELTATSNGIGHADFTHLTPGVWHIVVEKADYSRQDAQVTIKAGQAAEAKPMLMRRLR